jgi:acetolactate synthase-1/3 small subunit
MRHILSILLENHAGALSRVAGLFSARSFNIESLTVAPTEDPTVSRMTLVTSGSDDIVEQIVKQMNKLIDVIKLIDLNDGPHIERELMLIKVLARDAGREEIKRLVDIFRGRIIDVTDTTYVVELTGTSQKLDAFIEALNGELIMEVVRTGVSGIARGTRALSVSAPSATPRAPSKPARSGERAQRASVNPNHLL